MNCVANICRSSSISISEKKRKNFFAVTVNLSTETICFIYSLTLHGKACNRDSLIRDSLKRGCWAVLEEAWFMVYRKRAYEFTNPLASTIRYAVQHGINPEVSVLLSQ
jgi:hypothetical protein